MIPSGYSKTVISGTLPAGEIFATGFWCDEAPSSESATQDQANSFGADLAAVWSHSGSPASFNSTDMIVNRMTVYSYQDASGRATYVAEHPLSLSGTSSSNSLPNQCCLVDTLLTGSAGRRNRGRMYWPATAATLSEGEFIGTLVEAHIGWMSALITQWNSHIGDQHVVVLSQVAGASKSVDAIRSTSKVDTQRRRANRLTISFTDTVPVT